MTRNSIVIPIVPNTDSCNTLEEKYFSTFKKIESVIATRDKKVALILISFILTNKTEFHPNPAGNYMFKVKGKVMQII